MAAGSVDSLVSVPCADITVREVPWHHLAAVALREALAGEMLLRDAETFLRPGGPGPVFGADAGTVAYTAVAFTEEGLPVGHAALRWNGDDVELAGVYVVPGRRDSGVTAALLAATEAAARGLRAGAGAGSALRVLSLAAAVSAAGEGLA
jgi:GNAT superfamily N-acetyltransferase